MTPLKTKWGTFLLEFSAKGLYAVRFPGKYLQTRDRVSARLNLVTVRLKKALERYFKCFRIPLRVKLDLTGYTPFQRKVYAALMKIPAGKVVSYLELARKAGYPKAARTIGTAMRKNRLPIVIPCHRVVPSSGGLGNYSAGVKWKRFLLENEQKGHRATCRMATR